MTSDSAAYFALRYKDKAEGDWKSFAFTDNLDDLKRWANGGELTPAREVGATLAEDSEPVTAADRPALELLMNRVVDSMLAIEDLIVVAGASKAVFGRMNADHRIVDPILDSCPIVDEGDNHTIVALEADHTREVSIQMRKLERLNKGLDLLPAATLLSMVASFDTQMAEIVRELFSIDPGRFISSDRSIPLSDVLKLSSLEDLQQKLLDDEVYTFSRGSHEEQVLLFEKYFQIKIIENWKSWSKFIEIFERRNLLAHGEKRFTARYVVICTKAGSENSIDRLGKDITLPTPYLKHSFSVLLEFVILSVFSVWRKQFPAEEQAAFASLNQVSYKMIVDGNYAVPVSIINYARALKNVKIEKRTDLMLKVNLASAYVHSDKKDLAIQLLDSEDWSAVSDDFKLCIAALKQDIEEVVRIIPLVASSGLVKADELREWPALDFVRDHDRFKEAFEEAYGESLRSVRLEERRDDPTQTEESIEA